MSMPAWLRRAIGILSIGGGSIGITVALTLILQSRSPFEWVLLLGVSSIYAFGAWTGALLLERDRDALRANQIYWILQVPAIMSGALGYFVAGGFHLTPYLALDRVKVGANFLLGSTFQLNLSKPVEMSWVGVNVIALAVVWLLQKEIRQTRLQTDSVDSATVTP